MRGLASSVVVWWAVVSAGCAPEDAGPDDGCAPGPCAGGDDDDGRGPGDDGGDDPGELGPGDVPIPDAPGWAFSDDRAPQDPGELRIVGRYRTNEGSYSFMGELVTRYAQQVFEIDADARRLYEVRPLYRRSTRDPSGDRPYTQNGRLYLANRGGGFSSLQELDPDAAYQTSRIATVETLGPLVGVLDDHLYAVSGIERGRTVLVRSPLRATSDDISGEPVFVDWPEDWIAEHGEAMVGDCQPRPGPDALYCVVAGFPPSEIPPVCTDTCTATICDGTFPCPIGPADGVCSDDMGEPACPPGSDCTDCGAQGPYRVCFDVCATAGDGVCDEAAPGRGTCDPGTDCADCGPFETGERFELPRTGGELFVMRLDPETGRAEVHHREPAPVSLMGDLFVGDEGFYWLASDIYASRVGPPLESGEVVVRFLPFDGDRSEEVLRFDVGVDAPPSDLEGATLLLADGTLVDLGTEARQSIELPAPRDGWGWWEHLELYAP